MADASIRFMVELDATGQVKAIKALEQLGTEAAKQGKRFSENVSGGFRKVADEWARFVAGGVVLQRIFQSIGDTIRKAADQAKSRQGEWDKANNVWRSDRLRQMTGAAALRLTGADEETIASVQGRLDSLKSSGRDVGGDFAGIAKTFAQRGLTGDDLGMALKRAVEALGKRGHLDGFAESYAALAGGKGVGAGLDLTDLATGLVKRSFSMQDDQARALREGISGGTVGVDASGMVRALGEASADLAAAIKAVNAAGGLSLGAQGKHASLGGLDPRLGYAYSERAAQDGGLDWVDPGKNPTLGKRPDGQATVGDYASAAWESPVVQAAIAAAMIKGMDKALSSTVFKSMLGRVFGSATAVAGGAAAGGAGTAVVTGAGSTVMGTLSVMAARIGNGMARMGGGLSAGLAGLTVNPEILNGWTIWGQRQPQADPSKQIPDGGAFMDELARQATETNALLREQNAMMRGTAAVLVPAQAGN